MQKIYLVSSEADFMDEGHDSFMAVKCFSSEEDAIKFAASEATVTHRGEAVDHVIREDYPEEVNFYMEDRDGYSVGRMRVEPIDLC